MARVDSAQHGTSTPRPDFQPSLANGALIPEDRRPAPPTSRCYSYQPRSRSYPPEPPLARQPIHTAPGSYKGQRTPRWFRHLDTSGGGARASQTRPSRLSCGTSTRPNTQHDPSPHGAHVPRGLEIQGRRAVQGTPSRKGSSYEDTRAAGARPGEQICEGTRRNKLQGRGSTDLQGHRAAQDDRGVAVVSPRTPRTGLDCATRRPVRAVCSPVPPAAGRPILLQAPARHLSCFLGSPPSRSGFSMFWPPRPGAVFMTSCIVLPRLAGAAEGLCAVAGRLGPGLGECLSCPVPPLPTYLSCSPDHAETSRIPLPVFVRRSPEFRSSQHLAFVPCRRWWTGTARTSHRAGGCVLGAGFGSNVNLLLSLRAVCHLPALLCLAPRITSKPRKHSSYSLLRALRPVQALAVPSYRRGVKV